MIGFFADPYPDELFYSACARYTQRTNYPNKLSVMIEIFGRRGFSASYDFPTRLNHFISVLPKGHNYSIDTIIDENSLFPFYQPFLPKGRANLIRREMGSETNNRVQTRLAVNIKQIEPLKYLRYCIDCVLEDRKKYKETYWHRVHQLPGIILCPQHKCFLENSVVETGRMSSKYFQNAESSINLIHSDSTKFDPKNKNHRILLKITQDAEWLLSNGNLNIDYETIRERYFNFFLENGFCYYNGKINRRRIIETIQDFFSTELYNQIGFICNNNNWLISLLRIGSIHKIYNPIRHLLLLSFMGISIKDFFTNFVEYKPFGNPPYPCLNPASTHYGKMRIQKCEILDNITKNKKKQGLPLGIFSCDCDFKYQRIGPDKSDKDKFKYDRIREYGQIWESRFAELWKDLSLSSAEIGRILKIGSTSVGRHAIRLNVPMNTHNTRLLHGYLRHRNPKQTFSAMKAKYRTQWLKVIRQNPELNRKQLSNNSFFLYLWLKRNDSEWIEKHLPKKDTAREKIEFKDWRKIDQMLAPKIAKTCKEIIENKEFPVRICITEIIKRVGYNTWISKRTEKLPQTTKIINKYLETFENFMLRRIEWAKNYYIKKRNLPTIHRFKVKAGLKNKTSSNSNKIQNAINVALKEIAKSVINL